MKIVTRTMEKSMQKSIGIIVFLMLMVFVIAFYKGELFHPVAISTAVCGLVSIFVIYRSTYQCH